MIILPFLLGAVAGLSTYVGGRLAMRWGQRRDLLFGLTGAMVIGLALLDLLPEALESGQSVHGAHIVFGATVAGAVLYILLRRLPAAGAAGREGHHTEALSRMLAEMQVVARAHPQALW